MSAIKSSHKKRKRDESPTREVTIGVSDAKPGKGGPYLVSYPAVTAPADTAFNRYAKKKSKSATQNRPSSEVDDGILLAGETETVEFMTNEEETGRASEGGCQYLVALHNRRTGELSILPDLKNPHLLTHTVKALKSIQPVAAPSKTQFREAKTALGETFGTKKAKAAIRAAERNHVDIGAMTGVMDYVMESIQKGAEGLMTADEAKTFADENRLIPPFDASATEPDDVYPLHGIIPEAEWKALSVSAFDAASNEKERLALLPHRYSEYIKQELTRITSGGMSPKQKRKNLKLLQYISGMLAFRQVANKKDVDKERVYEKLQPLPTIIADSLLARFTEVPRGSTSHTSTSSTKTNLLAHIFALCLKLDQFATDTEVLAKDLSMKTTDVNQLFKSLGCKVVKLGDRERVKLGLPDSTAETKRAILTAPVEFPKPRLKRK
ncbi:hypothetical protein D9611_000864 [Ephemerocybe angulata]|uniref:Uncharacterized protein n=1 Tax=Ephemerocybe angulata TaxID=980116 RepID=A0A8H5BNJ0_9AGAR|nr:hypothetical protein D9611_000864 [Tulosesus angulatus]